eukprot:3289451-Pyramimonas_sp.AAC.1
MLTVTMATTERIAMGRDLTMYLGPRGGRGRRAHFGRQAVKVCSEAKGISMLCFAFSPMCFRWPSEASRWLQQGAKRGPGGPNGGPHGVPRAFHDGPQFR